MVGLEAAARLYRAYARLERALFDAMGGWIGSVSDPAVVRYLAVHCHRHAWHADLWTDLVPATAGLPTAADEEASIAPLLAALRVPQEPGADADLADDGTERLAVVARAVVPHLVARYTEHLAVADALSDGPARRTLTLVLRDELEGWQAAEVLLQRAVRTREQVERIAARRLEIESRLARGGGLPRAEPLGEPDRDS